MKKILLLAIALLIPGFFLLGFDDYLTLTGLKSGLEQFQLWRDQYPVMVSGAFFVIYVVVTALSLPGAAVMTLAAGALFGLVWGTVLVSFASTLGATLAFLVSRFLLSGLVQERYGERLKSINEGIRKDGAFYLFTLRLVPVVPFFLINLLMGLTPISTWTFFWVSQVGMFAGTVVYVNAGTQLALIESLSGIISPGLLFSFALLGFFPLLTKKILQRFKAARAYRQYSKPRTFDRNLIVIGGGAGGLVTAYIAAAVKAKVTLIESHKMGGDCLNYGCVPSKALIKIAKTAHSLRQASKFGFDEVQPKLSFQRVMSRVKAVIEAIEPHDSVERYTKLGVEVLKGYAKLVDPWTVEVALDDGQTKRLTARSIVLATGASPMVPPLPGIESVNMVTSDTLWEEFAKLDQVPKRLLVLGGGPIGCELAQSFARLGASVNLVEMSPRLLVREDEEVSSYVTRQLEQDGVEVLCSHRAIRFEPQGDEGSQVIVSYEGQERSIGFDVVLCAVGRTPRIEGFGLEQLGIQTDRTILTNEYLETLYPNIFAAGDVVGPYQFTHAAAHQAWFAAVNALFGHFKKFRVDYRIMPWVTFTDPEVARVGLNEAQALKMGVPFEVTRYELKELDRAITDGSTGGFVKVLTQPGKDRILGVTIVGDRGGDWLAEFVLAMKYGLGLNKILGTIHPYPTWAEANKYVAGEWKKAHAPEKILKGLEKYHAWLRGRD